MDVSVTTAESYPQLMLESQLCFPLYAASRRIVNAYTPFLKPLGLTYTQYIVFLCLWEYGETTVGDLCRRLYLDNGTITPMIKRMEQEGYVRRSRCAEDERVVKVRLSEQGWALREKVRDIPQQIGRCIPLPHEDAFRLSQLLNGLLRTEET
jgi:DNA-binding MarR family transcriptional regulator